MRSSLFDCAVGGREKELKKLWPWPAAAVFAALTIFLIALFYTCPTCNSDAAASLSLQPSFDSSASLIAPEFSHISKPISSAGLDQESKTVYHLEEPHILTLPPNQETGRNSSDSELGLEDANRSPNASEKNSTHSFVDAGNSDEPNSEERAGKAENISQHAERTAPLEHPASVSESHGSPKAPRVDQDLVAAKQAIIHAEVKPYTDLHASIYRNVTAFIKSYELMEQILRIYVYKEGSPPLVHTGPTVGIYASEGRFIQQLQTNKQFVTDDPTKAHLFFMPYSVTNMVTNLYVPDSHSMKPIVRFVTSYVDLIASKYPYWNESHGADHFFASCHDWGPATARKQPELRRNSIKVVCNADEKEQFVIGKDVSLPETYMHAAKPPKKLGGLPVRKRPYLAFFAGQMHGRVRPILLQYWKDKDKDLRIYEKMPASMRRKNNYVRHMRTSKFCICPMGYEVNSPRIVEAIYYDCVPVVIADNFVLPFGEVLNWPAFSVSIAEKDIPNLKQILISIPSSKYNAMQASLKHVRQHFTWHFIQPAKYDVFHMILHSLWASRLASISVNTT